MLASDLALQVEHGLLTVGHEHLLLPMLLLLLGKLGLEGLDLIFMLLLNSVLILHHLRELLYLLFLVSDDLPILLNLLLEFLSKGTHEGTKHLVAILLDQESPLQILVLFVKHRKLFVRGG